MRQSFGTAVIYGMLSVTLFGLLFHPDLLRRGAAAFQQFVFVNGWRNCPCWITFSSHDASQTLADHFAWNDRPSSVLASSVTKTSILGLSASERMKTTAESTSAEAFNHYLRGKLIAASNGWKNLLVRVYSEPRVEESVIYPAVAEPRLVRILSGAAVVEERELGGPWMKARVEAGNFFLTASQSPSEVRWRAIGPEPLETMHVYLGLPVFNRAIEEAFQKGRAATHLRDVSGFKDNFLSALLDGLHKEVLSRYRGSPLFVEGIAQSLAVHLVRTYGEETTQEYKGGLAGFRLRKITDLMETHLEDEFSLIRLAREAEMSEFHFSRAFKRTTGLTPSQYFIHLRLEKARRFAQGDQPERNRNRTRCWLHQPKPFRSNLSPRSRYFSKRIPPADLALTRNPRCSSVVVDEIFGTIQAV